MQAQKPQEETGTHPRTRGSGAPCRSHKGSGYTARRTATGTIQGKPLLYLSALSAHMIMQVYLISWHHVHCYISRLDIPADRLIRLKEGNRHCLEGLRVKRTRLFDMTLSHDRIQIAEAIARITIDGLKVYSPFSKNKVVQRLQGSGHYGP